MCPAAAADRRSTICSPGMSISCSANWRVDAVVRAGRLKALAVSSDKRLAALPDVPTVSQILPGFVVA